MTYWVIARFDKEIYMAADVRASGAAHSELLDRESNPNMIYSDGSEKLFGVEYVDTNSNSIKIGLCTSGYASGHGFTIAGILKKFWFYEE